MKKCIKCGRRLADDDLFCAVCGTKQDRSNTTPDNESLILKYSGYLDNEVLFKMAWAKENGLLHSDFPGEAEEIYRLLSLRGHSQSMFQYAMILLGKNPNDNEEGVKWLRAAARQGHIPSRNYLINVLQDDTYCNASNSRQSSNNYVGSGTTYAPTPTDSYGVMNGAQIAARMKDSVVEVIAYVRDNKFCASGFVISHNGFVITNAHAVMDEKGRLFEKICVKLHEKVYNAVVIAAGRPADGKTDTIDLALLFVERLNVAPATLGESSSCINGQNVFLIGNSLGGGTCITSGIISDVEREMSGLSYPYLMTDAAANHGNSGGPLLNDRGEVIGILVAGIDTAEGMNFAIPIDIAKAFIVYILKESKIPKEKLAELQPLMYKASNMMSPKWEKIFSGIKLVLEAVIFAVSFL